MKENKKQIGDMQPWVFELQQMVIKTPFWGVEIHSSLPPPFLAALWNNTSISTTQNNVKLVGELYQL